MNLSTNEIVIFHDTKKVAIGTHENKWIQQYALKIDNRIKQWFYVTWCTKK